MKRSNKKKKKKTKEIWTVKNIFLLDIVKYVSYQEMQKNSKVVNV